MSSFFLTSFSKRFWQFTSERFPLAVQGPMVLLFATANICFDAKDLNFSVSYEIYGIGCFLALCFFLRLRLFDEIKDYEVDLVVNPTRPLARGLLSIDETKGAIAILFFLEFCIVGSTFSWTGVVLYSLPCAYSLLMYEEFFVGGWLRPRLTLYALTHTFVAALLGLVLACMATEISPSTSGFLLALYNWFQFNVFEFARKTFSKEEENPKHDSYTSLFGRWGAIALTLIQCVFSAFLIYWFQREIQSCFILNYYAVVAAILTVAALFFAIKGNVFSAKVYRFTATLYLVAAYVLFII